MINRSLLLLVALSYVCLPALGQDEDYTLQLQDVSGSSELYVDVGEDADVYVRCDFVDGGDLQGYQWGVCHDGDYVTLEDGDVVNGSYTDDDDSGGAAITFTFEAVTVVDDGSDSGWTVGALLNVITEDVIEATDDAELYIATYELDDATGSEIEFCETLGSPAVTVRVIVDSDEIEPVQENLTGGLIVGEPPTAFQFGLGADDGPLDEMAVGDLFSVVAYVSDLGDGSLDTQGFQMAIAFDTDVIEAIEPDDDGDLLEPALADLDDGAGPAFFGPNFAPEGGEGLTVGVVYDLFGDILLPFGAEGDAVFHVDFEWVDTDTEEVDLEFEDTLGDPVIINQVVVDGDSYVVELFDLALTLEIVDPFGTVAGDGDTDGDVDLEDVFTVILYLYQDGPEICVEAMASLDDPADELDNADVLFALTYIFLDGPDPGDECVEYDCDFLELCP